MIKQNYCDLYFQIKGRGKIQGGMKEEEGKGKNKKKRTRKHENIIFLAVLKLLYQTQQAEV